MGWGERIEKQYRMAYVMGSPLLNDTQQDVLCPVSARLSIQTSFLLHFISKPELGLQAQLTFLYQHTFCWLQCCKIVLTMQKIINKVQIRLFFNAGKGNIYKVLDLHLDDCLQLIYQKLICQCLASSTYVWIMKQTLCLNLLSYLFSCLKFPPPEGQIQYLVHMSSISLLFPSVWL